ncbi:hypothetical protein [Ilumatobacter nonamiensis]|uniref:hypothetical protein n=1 Tax=Ilumatobacter nonamiensis TaxID=467093 RepID=UPI0011D29720|nr:hypothetical protein [Ilumatobacter nonamiensis]
MSASSAATSTTATPTTTDGASSTTTLTASSSSSTALPTTQPAAPPTTNRPVSLTIGTAEAVAATSRGVLIDDGSNTWDTVVFDDSSPRGLALLVDDRIVYQPATSTDIARPVDGFVIISDEGPESLYGEDDRRVTVFDVGHVDGRAVILAQSAVDRPANPDEAASELVLIDVLSLERTVLREAGGFESGYTDARFGAGAISAIFSVNAANSLEILELGGTVRHEIELPADTNLSLLDFDESVWLLEPDFVGDNFDPVLRTLQFDLDTADVRQADLPLISVAGLSIDTGFCDVADFLDDQIVCDRSQGSPILIDVDIDGASTSEVPFITFGTVRFRASQ